MPNAAVAYKNAHDQWANNLALELVKDDQNLWSEFKCVIDSDSTFFSYWIENAARSYSYLLSSDKARAELLCATSTVTTTVTAELATRTYHDVHVPLSYLRAMLTLMVTQAQLSDDLINKFKNHLDVQTSENVIEYNDKLKSFFNQLKPYMLDTDYDKHVAFWQEEIWIDCLDEKNWETLFVYIEDNISKQLPVN